MFRKTNMWRGISMTSALFLTVSLLAGNILETYRTSVDAFVGTRSQVTVTDDAEDSWTYQSEFTSAKEAYEGFQELAIRTSQETFALLKNENASLPLKSDAKITMFGIRSYAPVYSNSGGSVADGKSTVQIFDAFKERGFQINPSMMAAYEKFFEGKNGQYHSLVVESYLSIQISLHMMILMS